FQRPLNRYPEIRPTRLRAVLAQRFGAAPENLLVTRGTSEAIDLLIRAFCVAGRDNIVTTRPSFSMYRHYAAVQGADVIEVGTHRDRNFQVDADDVLAASNDATRLIFLCTPNNPTGTSIDQKTIVEILDQTQQRCAVVVDEAYIEFSSATSMANLLATYDNLIVLRTLSKALAFAGARCGAVIGPADVIDMLDAIQAPYALATPVVECVEKALEQQWLDEAKRRVKDIVSERQRVANALNEFSFVNRLWPSDANFVLVAVDSAADIMLAARDAGLLLRHFGGELDDCLRITIGNQDENDLLLKLLSNVEAQRG
ncbi:MAG: histidinol-phosphate transaminase, partial [Gammaproteobacteria bacterium]|nr:histidinol-phosphate transaminase [Gammaproteobacteria bacterium]